MRRDGLALAFRCQKRWSELEGRGCERWCGACERTVVDLSAKTELGARWTLLTHRGPEAPCVRYRTDGAGRVRFRPGWVARVAAALLAASSARASEAPDDVQPEVGQVHLCSPTVEDGVEYLRGIYVGGFGWRRLVPGFHAANPRGEAARRGGGPRRRGSGALPAGGRALRGQPPRARTRLIDGEAVVADLPQGTQCIAGEGRPLTIEFRAADTAARVVTEP
ncbi:MAG: hypothetical protein H6738_18345 [Alphaproteobacteria bacterium]|nr:hypothetical protein [Alphaproteobacteria bacterium]